MPSGVIRLRMSRTNHPMPMLDNPYSGDHSGLRGQKTRDSATLVQRKEPSMPTQPGTFKKYDDAARHQPARHKNLPVDRTLSHDGDPKLSRHGKTSGGEKGR